MKSFPFVLWAILCLLGTQALSAQNIKRDNFKFEPLIKPTLPVEDIGVVGIKLYYPDEQVNRDTIRKYIDNMKLLKGGFGFLDAEEMYAYREITVEDEGWDLLLEVAYLPQPSGETWTEKWETTDGLGLDVTRWVRRTKNTMPVVARLSDKSGKVLDMWAADNEMVISYGDRKMTTLVDENGVATLTMDPFIFGSAEEVEAAYARNGENFVQRQGVMIRLGEVLNWVYQHLYYRTLKDKLFLATAKSGKHDYSDLDQAKEKATQAIESGDYAQLTNPINTWEQQLSQANITDKKARINLKVCNMLHGNLAIAHMLQENWEKAWDHVLAYEETREMMTRQDPNSNVTTYTSVTSKEDKQVYALKTTLLDIMSSLKGKSNPVPDEPAKATEITKEIGKLRKNKDLTLFYTEDKYADFKKESSQYRDVTSQTESTYLSGYSNAKPNYEENPFYPQIQGLGTNIQALTINAIDNDVKGKPLPEEVTQLDFLDHLFCFGQGITEVPESIGNLKDLKWLYLQNNALTELPESIGELESLKILNVAKNDLTALPESIRNLKNLNKLVLKGNPISPAELKKIEQWLPEGCKIKI